jgi:hypothetical protein
MKLGTAHYHDHKGVSVGCVLNQLKQALSPHIMLL